MKNINIKDVTLSEEVKKERIAFFRRCKAFNKRIPDFRVVYTSILLHAIQGCKVGYNSINGIYDISLEILEDLKIDIDYDKALDDMYSINEKQIKSLPNINLLDNSVTGILVKLV